MFMKNNLLALASAILGGILGYFGFFWLTRQGFYALALPGAFVGMGAGVVKNRSIAIPILCGVGALALGVFTESQFERFGENDSMQFFLTHLHQLPAKTLIMIAIGAAIGFYVPFRQRESA